MLRRRPRPLPNLTDTPGQFVGGRLVADFVKDRAHPLHERVDPGRGMPDHRVGQDAHQRNYSDYEWSITRYTPPHVIDNSMLTVRETIDPINAILGRARLDTDRHSANRPDRDRTAT